MALPILVKNYLVTVNQAVAADATIDANTNSYRDRRNLLLNIKTQMITGGVSNVGPGGFTPAAVTAWVVEYSCDGVVAGAAGDNVDRWTSAFGTSPTANLNLQWDLPAATHSWMVLSQAGSGIEVCFDLEQSFNGAAGARMWVTQSAGAGFTGGSTTARPTATDETTLRANNYWGSGQDAGGAKAFKWHMWQSEDGEITRVVVFYNNNAIGCWRFELPQDPKTNWSGNRAFSKVLGGDNTTQTVNVNDWYDVANLTTYRADRISTVDDYNVTALYCTMSSFANNNFSQALTVDNDLSGEYALGVMGLASTEPGFTGRWGTCYDIYWGQEILGQPVDNYPSGGTRTWVQFGVLVFPWEGTVPQTA